MELAYHVVDVFTTTPLEGNPLAVFSDASALDAGRMQAIAKELNLSETTFILPNASRDGATRVRIFTPGREMDFAGHPTVGTAFVMRRLGIVPPNTTKFVLAENVGPVPVRVDDEGMIWLTTPQITALAEFPRERCAAAMSLREDDLLPNAPCRIFSAGNPMLFVPLRDPATVDRAVLDNARFLGLVESTGDAICAFVFAPTQSGAYSRMFAPLHGVVEDPATGSATGPLAAYMMAYGLVATGDGTRFISEQGTKMGRRSLLHVLVHGERGSAGIEVGGHVTYLVSATMTL